MKFQCEISLKCELKTIRIHFNFISKKKVVETWINKDYRRFMMEENSFYTSCLALGFIVGKLDDFQKNVMGDDDSHIEFEEAMSKIGFEEGPANLYSSDSFPLVCLKIFGGQEENIFMMLLLLFFVSTNR